MNYSRVNIRGQQSSVGGQWLHPEIVLAMCVGIVAASTPGFPGVTGYGTILNQLVVFSAWDLFGSYDLWRPCRYPITMFFGQLLEL